MKPTNDNTVAEIKAYLDGQGIKYYANDTKAKLLARVDGVDSSATGSPAATNSEAASSASSAEAVPSSAAPESPSVAVPPAGMRYTKSQLLTQASFTGIQRDLFRVTLKDNQTYTVAEALTAVENKKKGLF